MRADRRISRGLRNNNPGNIRLTPTRYKGEVRPSRDPAFREFESAAWGYRAIFVLLHTYRVRHNLQTLAEMLSRWAPPSENNTVAYINTVSRLTGIRPQERINTRSREMMIPLAAAISRVENGSPAEMRDVEEGWRLYSMKN